uniref:Uncharacterized protein n=1 Tax=Anguilla anguilla TaxID=7936 RepID=A0A0E9QYL9_ANGAN
MARIHTNYHRGCFMRLENGTMVFFSFLQGIILMPFLCLRE